MKFWLYSSASLAACVGLLCYTYVTRAHFYPSVIYLVTSKVSVLVLSNAALVLTTLFGRLVKSFFLGALREVEVELLHENVRYAVTETCLALTIFRDEISFHVMALFTALVFLKIFHWLAQARIEFIEQTDTVSRLTHARLSGLMAMLAAVDMGFVVWCSLEIMETGPSVFILFGFEFLILLVAIVALSLRYVLYAVDLRMNGAWTNKYTYLFYLELVSEVIKLVVYLIFFMLIFAYYGMPLHIVRDLWVSFKNLQRRISSYFRYRKITAHLNERFPNPTELELQEMDRTCIICREEMTSDVCKKLPCSHIFHVNCLKMWVQRQQTCPTCRSTIPTGPRHPDPNTIPGGAAARVARPGADNSNAAQPAAEGRGNAQERAAPRFRFGVSFGRAAPPTSQPEAPSVTTSGAAQDTTPPGYGGIPAAAAGNPFAPGYSNPYMFPMMFVPGMGSPFGYGMPGAYGMMPGMSPLGHMPAQSQQGMQQPAMDPDGIQQQINFLHAQLAMLQASAAQPSTSQPTGAVSQQTTPAFFLPTAQSHTSAPPVQASSQISAPTASAAFTAPAVATGQALTAVGAGTSTESPREPLEEKRPAPLPSQEQGSLLPTDGAHEPSISLPVTSTIPSASETEADRRREELRRRYNRIYGTSSNDGETKTD
uniref:RING-type E3 ubiquitin transferase n=1 Tax=Hyaloperonospora arabidopsidis (strain Emoy2) TaxID=559515 RepID=M4C0U1_HYAAE